MHTFYIFINPIVSPKEIIPSQEILEIHVKLLQFLGILKVFQNGVFKDFHINLFHDVLKSLAATVGVTRRECHTGRLSPLWF